MRLFSLFLFAAIAFSATFHIDSQARSNSQTMSPSLQTLRSKINQSSLQYEQAWIREACDNYSRTAYKEGYFEPLSSDEQQVCYDSYSQWFSFYRAYSHYKNFEYLKRKGSEERDVLAFYLEKAVRDMGEAWERGHPDAGPLVEEWQATLLSLGGPSLGRFVKNRYLPDTYISNGKIVRRTTARPSASRRPSPQATKPPVANHVSRTGSKDGLCAQRMKQVEFCPKSNLDLTTSCSGSCYYHKGGGPWCDHRSGAHFESKEAAAQMLCREISGPADLNDKRPTRDQCLEIKKRLNEIKRIGGLAAVLAPKAMKKNYTPCKNLGVTIY